ncbi:MAG: flavin-containing monooxygenase [Phototrophicaceae bacterium]
MSRVTSDIPVVVIGAGPAGLATAYYLRRAGVPFRVIDRAAHVADTWSAMYPSLRLNTTKWYSHMPDLPMPRHYPIFPTGAQYYAHLQDFAHRHDLLRDILFGVDVQRITPLAGRWCIETRDGTIQTDAVIAATGRFGRPVWPKIDGLDQFTGTVIHAHEYKGIDAFVGARVMVIGNGPSGVDIAPELGRAPHQPPVLMAMRTGVVLRPRYPYGLPKQAWTWVTDHLPPMIGRPLITHIESLKFEALDRVGIRTPRPDQVSRAAGTRGRELIDAVARGQVICVAGVRQFSQRCVTLEDGSVYELDAVILATGYAPVIDQYLDAPHAERDVNGWLVREQTGFVPLPHIPTNYPANSGREVRGLPGLYLVGQYYVGKGALYNFNVEAQIVAQQVKARLG